MSKNALIALLVFACLIELGVIVHRLTGRMVAEAPAEPPPLPVVVRRPSVRPANELVPEPAPMPADNFPVSAAESADHAGAAAPALPPLSLPPELRPSPAFVQQLRQARAAGVDLWLLAHVCDTQFQRQLAAWQRDQSDPQKLSLDPNQMRREFIEALAGSSALRRLQVAEWARHRQDLRGPDISLAQIENLFELEKAREERLRAIQRAYASREIDLATYAQRQADMRKLYDAERQRIMGSTSNTGAPVTIVK